MTPASSSGLSPKLIREYHECGFTVAGGLFEPQRSDEWINECDRLTAAYTDTTTSAPRLSGRAHLTKGHIFDRLDPVIDVSPVFHRIAHDERLISACSQLFGEPAALFKDKLIMKPPGTYGYLIHQDYPYWEHLGLPADHMLTAWVAIDASTIENGTLELFPALHHARIPGTPDAPMDVDESLVDLTTGICVNLDPADVLFFHSLVPHRSAPNQSTLHRRALLLTYVPARYGNLYDQYYRKKMH